MLEPALPDRAKDELHGESVLFSVREARLISHGGAVGGGIFGAFVAAAGIFALSSRGKANVTIDLPFILTTGDTPEGALFLLVAGVLGIVAGLGMILASPILRRMPGGLVVGTPTRILHVGRWRVHAASWRDVESVSLGKDGSVVLKRHRTDGRATRSLDIVEPPQASVLVTLIATILDPKAGADPGAPAAATRGPEFTFRSTHTPGVPLGPRLVGLAVGAIGILVAVAFTAALFGEGTVTASTNGGPSREVGPGDAEAWIPVLIGGIFALVGFGIFYLGRSRPSPVTYVADAEKLTMTHADGTSSSVEWRVFTGDALRRKGPHGAVLEFPLRRFERTSKRGRSRREVVRMVGVENPDEVLAVIGPRIA